MQIEFKCQTKQFFKYLFFKKPSALRREHPAFKKMKFINFLLFCGSFLPSGIRIQSGSRTVTTQNSCIKKYFVIGSCEYVREVPKLLRDGKSSFVRLWSNLKYKQI